MIQKSNTFENYKYFNEYVMYKDVIYDNSIKKGNGIIQELSFCMLKLSWHQFKRHRYKFSILIIILMVITKKIPKKYIWKKMRQESKQYTTQNQLNTKEGVNGMRNKTV